MKITITTVNGKLCARLPFGMTVEKPAPPALARVIGNVSLDVTPAQAMQLMNALQKYKKEHPQWHFFRVRKK